MTVDPVEELRSLYERRGPHHVDEAVSQLDHALQAASLARAAGAPPALVAAALLHDVGHLVLIDAADGRRLAPSDELRHDDAGASYLAAWFGPEVTEPVRLHSAAARWLCATEVAYRFELSDPARRRMEARGGPMTRPEAEVFTSLPGHAEAVLLRRWDDAAKVVGIEVAPFSDHEALLRSLVRPGSV